MINSISVTDIASFGSSPQRMDDLGKVNYIFGSNGSGKTTISRLIAAPDSYPMCQISWAHATKLATFVYNKDFVDDNFKEETIKGIFTLGKVEIDMLEAIQKLRKEKTEREIKIKGLTEQHSEKKECLAEHEDGYQNIFWEAKGRLNEFDKAFLGFSRKALFKEKLLAESTDNTAPLLSREDLRKRYKSVFNNELIAYNLLLRPSFSAIQELQKNPIMGKKIIGKEDVAILQR